MQIKSDMARPEPPDPPDRPPLDPPPDFLDSVVWLSNMRSDGMRSDGMRSDVTPAVWKLGAACATTGIVAVCIAPNVLPSCSKHDTAPASAPVDCVMQRPQCAALLRDDIIQHSIAPF